MQKYVTTPNKSPIKDVKSNMGTAQTTMAFHKPMQYKTNLFKPKVILPLVAAVHSNTKSASQILQRRERLWTIIIDPNIELSN